MYILGINAFHGDSSACLIRNGKLLASVEEERFLRIKHWAGFPERSIQYCLDEAGISMADISHIGIARDPKANIGRKIKFSLKNRQGLKKIISRASYLSSINNIPKMIAEKWGEDVSSIKEKVIRVEHHLAHMASTFLVSPFDRASILTVDGFGDFVSSLSGYGEKNQLKTLDRIYYPHSLGLFYTLITQFLGFPKYGDEYKVMGLASFGVPKYVDKLTKIIFVNSKKQYELDLSYFSHHDKGVEMNWASGEPSIGNIFTNEVIEELGPPREVSEPITQYHKDIASSVQVLTESIIFGLLNKLYEKTQIENLCLAGGVAMNSVANGKIFDNTPFQEIYIQSAAGDAGLSLGAAYYIWNITLGNERSYIMNNSYWGEAFKDEDISDILTNNEHLLNDEKCIIEKVESDKRLCELTANHIANGMVVGWFQGRMEWGPRALGNRSIVADPRRHDMVDILNSRIKRRESFRPFAPSILIEKTNEYFEKDYPDPFMLKVYPVREEKRDIIPAVTHVDGTGRLQTVDKEDNPLYYDLIKSFEKITGVPVVLNTSFNENEPIVCTPKEGLDCFLRTKMDVLVMGHYMITRAAKN